MAIHSTASLANVYDSIKKFFVDSLYTTSSIPTMFDKTLSNPNTIDLALQKWVVVNFGEYSIGNVSNINLDVYCCTRNDIEGYDLIRLRDTVMGYLTNSSALDGKRRIKLYESHPTNPWVEVGGMVLFNEVESQILYAPDETKYKALGCSIKWGSII